MLESLFLKTKVFEGDGEAAYIYLKMYEITPQTYGPGIIWEVTAGGLKSPGPVGAKEWVQGQFDNLVSETLTQNKKTSGDVAQRQSVCLASLGPRSVLSTK